MLSYSAQRSFGPGVVNVTTDILDDQGDSYRVFLEDMKSLQNIAYGLILAGPTVQLFTLKLSTVIAVSTA